MTAFSAPAIGVQELADAADAFAVSLSDVIAGEPQLRYQGMPSDGDSQTVYRALGAEGWIGRPLADASSAAAA